MVSRSFDLRDRLSSKVDKRQLLPKVLCQPGQEDGARGPGLSAFLARVTGLPDSHVISWA